MKKKKIVIWVSVSLAFMLLFTGVFFAFINARIPPKGYSKYNSPISYGLYTSYTLGQQFPDINPPPSVKTDKQYFLYKGELHYVKAQDSESGVRIPNFSAFKDTGNKRIGDFIIFGEEWGTEKKRIYYDATFLYDSYLYYGLNRTVYKTYYKFTPEGFKHKKVYYKYEYYRFDLETGKNQEISLDIFFEKLHEINNNVWLNK